MKRFNRCVNSVLCFLLLMILSNVHSQGFQEVNGIVTGIGDKPIADVEISVEGLEMDPIITNENGNFSLQVPDKYVWLLIKPLGNYKQKRIFLNGLDFVHVKLVANDWISGDDVISRPIIEDLRKNIMGTNFDLNLSNVSKLPYYSVDQYFQGRVPGMVTTNHSGMPGSGTYSFLRGISSLNAGNQPLIFVDGMPYENHGLLTSIISGNIINPFVSIVPEDIVDLTVINDISLLSLYGAKASNGIIWINTLKPLETKTTMDVTFKTGFSRSVEHLPVLNVEQFKTLSHEILMTSSVKEERYIELFPGLFDDPSLSNYYKYNHSTNWQEKVFRNSTFNDLYIKIKGGDAIAKYGLSASFSNHDGIIKETDFSRVSLRFVGSFNIFKWMQLSVNNNLMYTNSNLMETGPVYNSNPILVSLQKSPFAYPYKFDNEGNELSYIEEADNFGISNPVGIINGVMASSNNFRFAGTYKVNADISDHMKGHSLLGVNFNNVTEGLFLPNTGMTDYNNGIADNITSRQNIYLKSIYNDNRISYKNIFSNIHALNGFVGFRLHTNKLEQDIGIGMNTPSDEYKSLRFAESSLSEIAGNLGNWNSISFYGGINYALLDRYFLGVNSSVEGSSRIGQDAESAISLFDIPFGIFPSVSAAWRISNESFLKYVRWLDDFRLKASYGLAGNDNIGNYNSRRYYEQWNYRETTGIVLGTMPNTMLTYETNVMFDVGLDLSIYGERVNFSFNYFNYLSKDLLVFEKQQVYVGYNQRPANGCSLKNSGFEWHLLSRLLETSKFHFDLGANFTYLSNSILDITAGSEIMDIEGGEVISLSNNPANSFYGFKTDGIFSTSEEADRAGLVNTKGMKFRAGDIRFIDISGPNGEPDGVIDNYDKTFIGSSIPDFFGGVDFELKYGKFSFYSLIQFVVGIDVYNFLRYQTEKMSDLSNQNTAVLRRWTYEGQETDIPRALWNDPIGNSAFSDRWIEDGSYIRLKNLILSYSLPDNMWFLRNADVYISANNLFTFSKYLGYDPEVSFSSTFKEQGIDYVQVPMMKSFMLGVRFGL